MPGVTACDMPGVTAFRLHEVETHLCQPFQMLLWVVGKNREITMYQVVLDIVNDDIVLRGRGLRLDTRAPGVTCDTPARG